MKKTRSTIVLLTICLIAPSISSQSIVANQQNNRDTPIIDYLRGMEIEFKPPRIIQDCGSFFLLDVNISRTRFRFPRFFSISVFLKTKDEFGKNRIVLIGSEPSVFLPCSEEKITVSIPCLTSNNFLSYFYSLRSGEKSEFNLSKGAIGVKIEKFCRNILDGIKLKFLLTVKDAIIWRFCREFVSDFPTTRAPKNIIRIISRGQRIVSLIRSMDRLILWEDVKVSPPFVCSKKINFEYTHVDNETDVYGNFKVTVNVTNQLDEDVKVMFLIDIADNPFINTLIPTAKVTKYNVGFDEDNISAGGYVNKTIRCKFPEEGSFSRKDYSVMVECGPYIPIGDTNRFGILFYDVRWKMIVKLTYVVGGKEQSLIQKFWYNLPIFWGGPKSANILPAYYGSTIYKGDISEDYVEGALKQLSAEVKSWISLFFFYALLLIGFALVGYLFVRKKYS